MEENRKEQECIPVGYIPTTAVPATRCQYCGLVQTSFKADPPRRQNSPEAHPLGAESLSEAGPLWGQISPCGQTRASKTLPSLAVRRNVKIVVVPLPCLISSLWSPQVLHNSQSQPIGGSVFDSFSTTSGIHLHLTEDLFRSLQAGY